MRAERRAGVLAVLALLGVVAFGVLPPAGTEAAFSATTGTATNSLSSAADWLPPQVARVVASKSEGGIPGYIRQGGQYRVYAAVADDPSSNPPTGLGAVTAGLTGLPNMGMTAVPATVAGVGYTHQTALQTAPAIAPAGTYAGWVRASDLSTPPHTSADFPVQVTVDNTAPAGASVGITNGGVVQRPDSGDRVTVTWGEAVDPHSVVANWTGAAPVQATVRITNNGSNDMLTVYNDANNAILPMGSIALGQDYVAANRTFGAPGAAVGATVAWSANQRGFVVTLGTASGSVVNSTTAGTYAWTPANTVYDPAGNRSGTTVVTETGTADRDF